MITVVRKNWLCKCGCAGKCTLGAVMEIVTWSFLTLLASCYPQYRHDGAALDPHRAKIYASQPFPCVGVLCQFRADWEELAVGMGFKTWASPTAPCLECDANANNMHTYCIDVASLPFQARTQAGYNAEVRNCTMQIKLVSPQVASDLQDALFFDKRKNGGRGRCVHHKIRGPASSGVNHLEIGDRLEVGADLVDTHTDLRLLPAGSELTFFRASSAVFLTALNPLFQVLDFSDICGLYKSMCV